MLKFLKENLAIILLVIGAFAIRVLFVTEVPPSLNWDEVSHGFNAYSILKTGKDEWGERLPTIFRAYGDYKLPAYIYLTAISELFFGVTDFAVRFPSVLAGSMTVLFSYLLIEKITKKKLLAFLTAFFVAIEPWSFFLSRIAVEANLSLFFVVAGAYFFFLGIEKKSWKILLSSFFWGMSLWTYNSARIFTPLLVFSFFLIYRRQIVKIFKIKKFLVISYFLLATFFLVPMLFQFLSSNALARFEKVTILDEGAIANIGLLQTNFFLPYPFSRLVVNKLTYFLKEFFSNYFSYFSLDFLFLKGGSQYQFSVGEFGVLYLINLPFWFLGLFTILFRLRKDSSLQSLAVWLLLAPIPASLVREAPHVLRSILILPIPMFLVAVGLMEIRKRIKFRFLTYFYLFFLICNIFLYGRELFTNYRKNYSWVWQYGYRQVVTYLKENYQKYDLIIVSKKYGEPHEFLLFYWPWEPERYQNDPNLVRFYQSGWFWVDGFDKFVFVNDWDIPRDGFLFITEKKLKFDCSGQRCLLVTSPSNNPVGWKYLDSVLFLNNQKAFEIYEN